MNPDLFIFLIVGIPIVLAIIWAIFGDCRSNRPKS